MTWLPIPDYEGFYEVSCCGQVRSVTRKVKCGGPGIRTVNSKVLKPANDSYGYQVVSLSKGTDKQKLVKVHRLVLLAFVGAPPKGMEACHYDGDPQNNNLSNLRWDTAKENWVDRKRHGRIGSTLQQKEK